MDAAAWGFIGTLAGAVVGATASIATTVITGRSESRLQSQADSLKRTERARAFQRDNLLALQEALQDLMRSTGRAYFEYTVSYRKTGEWGGPVLVEETNENCLLSARRVAALIERVADDLLRSEAKDIKGKTVLVILAHSKEDAENALKETTRLFESFMDHLGKVLRGLY